MSNPTPNEYTDLNKGLDEYSDKHSNKDSGHLCLYKKYMKNA